MSNAPLQSLRAFRPAQKFLIGIDSDGCVFDTMELKHKECFIPTTIRHFGLQAISKYAREAAEFVNLASAWRGSNRFVALLKVMDLLETREAVRTRKVPIARLEALRSWIARASLLSNATLKASLAEAQASNSSPEVEELSRVLAWSEDVNLAVKAMMPNVPVFTNVHETLAALAPQADLIVCSGTPTEALNREWLAHDLSHGIAAIVGQEQGSKTELLQMATANNYSSGHSLMIGDAYGDMKAAQRNSLLFYPIIPGREEEAWARLREEAAPRFFAETYAGAYEAALIAQFTQALPSLPPWQTENLSSASFL